MLTKISGWRTLARELVTIGADIHALETRPRRTDCELVLTPFMSLFTGLQQFVGFIWDSSSLQWVVTMWLEDLVASGVDLVEYGRKEKEILDLSSTTKCATFSLDCDLRYGGGVWHIVNFDFGAAPSDWHIWWAEPTDFLAGEFWAMIESPEEFMPGSWID